MNRCETLLAERFLDLLKLLDQHNDGCAHFLEPLPLAASLIFFARTIDRAVLFIRSPSRLDSNRFAIIDAVAAALLRSNSWRRRDPD